MTAISAAAVSLRTLVDGSIRITLDIEPKDAAEAFALFGKPGQPIAVAALKEGFAAVPAPKTKPGPLCIEACELCEDPVFQQWFGFDNAYDVKQSMLEFLGIDSRKRLDEDPEAARKFIENYRQRFLRWKRENT